MVCPVRSLAALSKWRGVGPLRDGATAFRKAVHPILLEEGLVCGGTRAAPTTNRCTCREVLPECDSAHSVVLSRHPCVSLGEGEIRVSQHFANVGLRIKVPVHRCVASPPWRACQRFRKVLCPRGCRGGVRFYSNGGSWEWEAMIVTRP